MVGKQSPDEIAAGQIRECLPVIPILRTFRLRGMGRQRVALHIDHIAYIGNPVQRRQGTRSDRRPDRLGERQALQVWHVAAKRRPRPVVPVPHRIFVDGHGAAVFAQRGKNRRVDGGVVGRRLLGVGHIDALRVPRPEQRDDCRRYFRDMLGRGTVGKAKELNIFGGTAETAHRLDRFGLAPVPQLAGAHETGVRRGAVGDKDEAHLDAGGDLLGGHAAAAKGLIIGMRREHDSRCFPVNYLKWLKPPLQTAIEHSANGPSGVPHQRINHPFSRIVRARKRMISETKVSEDPVYSSGKTIMKVGILAGGYGTRLAEETEIRPKPMVEIGGMPILWHIMMHYRHYGHQRFRHRAGLQGRIHQALVTTTARSNSNLTVNVATGEVKHHGEPARLDRGTDRHRPEHDDRRPHQATAAIGWATRLSC